MNQPVKGGGLEEDCVSETLSLARERERGRGRERDHDLGEGFSRRGPSDPTAYTSDNA